jgi:nicotinamide-nucleotide amidase
MSEQHAHISGDGYPEKNIRDLMLAYHQTLAIAESCTGGLIADRLTNIPGSSEYFKGAVVSYQTEIKTEVLGLSPDFIKEAHVVSEAVAIEMAKSVRKLMRADFGFGITGMLGPTGDGVVAVGTVCMAVVGANGVRAQTCLFDSNRRVNKEAAGSEGLRLIELFLIEQA